VQTWVLSKGWSLAQFEAAVEEDIHLSIDDVCFKDMDVIGCKVGSCHAFDNIQRSTNSSTHTTTYNTVMNFQCCDIDEALMNGSDSQRAFIAANLSQEAMCTPESAGLFREARKQLLTLCAQQLCNNCNK
jgi:hypothetical protein